MPPKIPLVNLEAQHEPIRAELLDALTRCLDSHSYILGESVERLEVEIARRSGVGFAVGTSSATDALLMGLMALGVGRGDEVVTTAYSFFATAGAIVRLGARPVFVDIEEGTYNIDVAAIESAVSEATKAIMPVHLYGQCADMDPILELAEAHGLPVVEDAAQAIGASTRDGRRAGSLGTVAAFSFYPSKNLAAMGDAGMALTQDEGLAHTLRRLRNHGAQENYVHEIVGGNFRMDAVQAAVLNVKLPHLDSWTEGRRERARRYNELFLESGLVDEGSVRIPTASGGHVYHQYVIRVEARDALREYLAGEGIASGVYYPIPLPLQPCFDNLGYAPGDFPVAERASRETLALPVYAELRDDQQRLVVDAVARFLEARAR
jgi:dTDP-4-amino-4,6-dideoxygalactose transaminase